MEIEIHVRDGPIIIIIIMEKTEVGLRTYQRRSKSVWLWNLQTDRRTDNLPWQYCGKKEKIN